MPESATATSAAPEQERRRWGRPKSGREPRTGRITFVVDSTEERAILDWADRQGRPVGSAVRTAVLTCVALDERTRARVH